MSTFYSRLLLRSELDRFVAAAKDSPYFQSVNSRGHITMEQPSVPDLDRYHFGQGGSITLKHKTRDTESVIDRSFAILEGCTAYVARVMIGFDVNESGKPFDPGEEFDVGVTFGIDEDGPVIRISSGDISPGNADIAYRQRLFNGSFQALRLADKLKAVVHAGRLWLEVKTDEIHFSPDARQPPIGYDPSAANLVLLNLSEVDGGNFHQVSLHLFTPSELRSGVEALVKHLGKEKIVASSLTIVCDSAGFPIVRDHLNASGLTPWEITCQVVSGDSIDDLDQAVSKYESFGIRGFALKVPKVGFVDANIFYSDNTFQIKFCSLRLSSKKMESLKSLVTELAGIPNLLVSEEG